MTDQLTDRLTNQLFLFCECIVVFLVIFSVFPKVRKKTLLVDFGGTPSASGLSPPKNLYLLPDPKGWPRGGFVSNSLTQLDPFSFQSLYWLVWHQPGSLV